MKAQARSGMRKRVSRETVRNASKKGAGNGRLFRLPTGIQLWEPKKAGTYAINILPYEVKAQNHPDDGIKPGAVWYRRPIKVHRSVGPEQAKIICPTSIGKACPICQHATKLRANYEENKDAIRAITPQNWMLYNVMNPDDADTVSIFAFSCGKFASVLDDEVSQQSDDSNLFFYDCNDEGRTLKVRFKMDKHMGQSYLQADRIDFVKRPPMDDEEVFAKTIELDSVLIVLSFDKISAMFDSGEVAEGEESDGDDEVVEEIPKTKKSKPAPMVDEDDEEREYDENGNRPGRPKMGVALPRPIDEDEDEDEEEAAPPPPKSKKKSAPPPVDDDDDEDLVIDTDDEDEEDLPPPPKNKSKKKAPPPPVDDEDEDEDDDE